MFSKTRAAAAGVVAATMLVAMPTVAHADSFGLHSSTGRTYVYYDDPANQIWVCDQSHNDGVGAYMVTSYGWEVVVYNGCQSRPFSATHEGNRYDAVACDYVLVNGARQPRNCVERYFYA